MDFKPYFKVHKLVSKNIILGQMTDLNMIFHVVCQFIDLLKYKTRPSFLVNFGTANLSTWKSSLETTW